MPKSETPTTSSNSPVAEQFLLTGMPREHADTRPSQNQIFSEDKPIHDWYRFVLSYPPHLVRDYVSRFSLDAEHQLLDPFCGTGTTPVEAKKIGIPAVGIEALPLSAWASRTKLQWDINPDDLRFDAELIAKTAQATLESWKSDDLLDLTPAESRLILKNSISPKPLHQTLILRDAINSIGGSRRDHLWLALARQLPTEIGNLRFGPEIGLGQIKEDAAVINVWAKQVNRMADDLEQWRQRGRPRGRIIEGDARNVGTLLSPQSVDAVITSPPYPNEKDYTRTVRLESVILGLFSDNEHLRDVKRTLVRSNSRSVYKADDDDRWLDQIPAVTQLADQIEARRVELGKTSGFERMYHRVTRLYFGGMARHFESLKTALKPGAQLAYVVGDQASYFRIMIRTGELLGEIAAHCGYEVIGRELFRTRAATATRSQLNEEVLLLRWPG